MSKSRETEHDQQARIERQSQDASAVLQIDSSYYLIQNTQDGYVFQKIDPVVQRLQFMRATRNITDSGFFKVERSGPAPIEAHIFSAAELSIQWSARLSHAPEPTVILTTESLSSSEKKIVKITEEELLDMFLPQSNQGRKASFFTIDTTASQVIGIALNREYPVLILLSSTPTNVLSDSSEVLRVFLSKLYEEYRKKLSALQKQIDDRLFDECGPDGILDIQTGVSLGVEHKKRADVLKHLFVLKTLLLASPEVNAQQSLSFPNLLVHAPFLGREKTEVERGLLAKIFAGNHDDAAQHAHVITFDEWNSIVFSDPKELFKRESGSAIYRPWLDATQGQSATPVSNPVSTPAPPIPIVRQEEHISPVHLSQNSSSQLSQRRPTQAEEQLAAREEVRLAAQRKEKQQSLLAKRVLREFGEFTHMFAGLELTTLSHIHVQEIDRAITRTLTKIDAHTQSFGLHADTEGAIQIPVAAQDISVQFASFDQLAVAAYMTGYQAVDFRERVEKAFSALNEITTLSRMDASSFDRSFAGMRRPKSALHTSSPEVVKKLIVSTRRMSSEIESTYRHVDLLLLSYVSIVLQIIGVLQYVLETSIRNTQHYNLEEVLSFCLIYLRRLKEYTYNLQPS